ncbi:MAG: type IV secretory system conjugative DNA transfer family protein [Lachnospiraceae bacterium]|nr:type IV secretory system conjugative DNA transfer family protein [Lachnospiraceae bacterium]
MAKQKGLEDLKWGNIKAFNKAYSHLSVKREPEDNDFILSESVRLRLTRYRENNSYNNNVIVLGGAGAGKTKLYVKPNILQRSCSYVVTDKAGLLYNDLNALFKSSGYTVKVINSLDPERSDYYNPFVYIKTEEDITDVANALLAADESDVVTLSEKRMLLEALISYVKNFADDSNRNFKMVKQMLSEMEHGGFGDSGDNWKIKPVDDLDRRFLEVDTTNPDHPCLSKYDNFRIMVGTDKMEIAESIIKTINAVTAGVIDRSGDLDSVELDKLGDSKRILFIVRPNTGVNSEFPALIYSQIFTALFKKAAGMPLDYPVHCMMSEFADNGKIYDFPRILMSAKKYDVSCSLILRSIDDLKNMYKDYATIIRSCSMQVYMGSRDRNTIEYVAQQVNETKSKVAGTLYTEMLNDLEDDECIVIATGGEAYYDNKF